MGQKISQVLGFVWREFYQWSPSKLCILVVLMMLGVAMDLLLIYCIKSIGEMFLLSPRISISGGNPAQKIFFSFFLALIIAATLVRLWSAYLQARYTFSFGCSLGSKGYKNILESAARGHEITKESFLHYTAVTSQSIILSAIQPAFSILSALIFTTTVLGYLLYLMPEKTILVCAFFAIVYVLSNQVIRRRLLKNSVSVNTQSARLLQKASEDFDLKSTYHLFDLIQTRSEGYASIARELRRCQGENISLMTYPRHLIEASTLLLFCAYIMLSVDYQSAVAESALVLFAALRLLPVINMAFIGLSKIMSDSKSIASFIDNYNKPVKAASSKFYLNANAHVRAIVFKDIVFSWSGQENLLDLKTIVIDKGEKVAVWGESGAGKSTFAQLAAGLISPHTGSITYFSPATKRLRIGYVPQDTSLVSGSIVDNVLLGREYDSQSLKKLFSALELTEFFDPKDRGGETFPQPALSGGQRQRLALARAIYEVPDILILDEATSALDYELEVKITRFLLDLRETTIIFATHSNVVRKMFSRIIQL